MNKYLHFLIIWLMTNFFAGGLVVLIIYLNPFRFIDEESTYSMLGFLSGLFYLPFMSLLYTSPILISIFSILPFIKTQKQLFRVYYFLQALLILILVLLYKNIFDLNGSYILIIIFYIVTALISVKLNESRRIKDLKE